MYNSDKNNTLYSRLNVQSLSVRTGLEYQRQKLQKFHHSSWHQKWTSSSSSSVFCLKAGPSLQADKTSLHFCWRQVFHCKLRNQGCSFTRDLIGAVASHCFLHPALSLASEQTLKDLKRSLGHQRGEEWIWLTGPPEFTKICHRG